MIRIAAFAAALLAGSACSNEAQSQDAAAQAATPTAASLQTGVPLTDLYTHLHANPELSFQESATSALLAEELRALGFDVTERLGDEWVRAKAERDQGEVRGRVGGYGVVGVLENGDGPTVLIRADMDALPINERTGLDFA
ncbi:MAG: hypothetical protein AAFY19_11075, partial [Pseudomonadota bacterium]